MAALSELKKFLADPIWRLSNLYWVTDKAGKRVLFKPNWMQRELIRLDHPMMLILKARQLGVTTFYALSQLDRCLFKSDQACGLVTHRAEDSERIFREKTQFAYNNLPEWLRDQRPAIKNESGWLILSNGSSLRVSTSMRSGTLQHLHISEFGKICAEFPRKAKEIVTGCLNAVDVGQNVTIESTAEGQEGYFYDYCRQALDAERAGRVPTVADWRFVFFPWFRHPGYTLNPKGVVIPKFLEEYFAKLASDQGIQLDDGQRAWYAKKLAQMNDWNDMKREYPSTPEEAFEQSVEGAYYAVQFTAIARDNRVTAVPHRTGVPVDTWWDIGVGDQTCIWFTQDVEGTRVHVIDYYSNSGESIVHYVNHLQTLARERKYVYGRMVAPHDIMQRSFQGETAKTTWEVARELGIRFDVAPKLSIEDGIEATRNMLSICWFDEARCAEGLKALKAYHKEWDATAGTWKNRPDHNWASHGADSFRTMAVSHRFRNALIQSAGVDVSPSAWY